MSVLALEAAIERDPDDLEAFAVYGDYLAEQGDPRGELIATQLAAERDPALEREALRVFAKHRDYLLGPLGSMIAANAFTWRAGFIRSAKISPDRLLIEGGARVATSLAEVVAALLAHPSGRFLAELEIRAQDRDVYNRNLGSQREVVSVLANARPRVLRRLQLGDTSYGIAVWGSIGYALPALAGLHTLRVEGDFHLGPTSAPTLRELVLSPTPFRSKLAYQLAEAPWPALASLTLDMTSSPIDLARLLERANMPSLRHLGVPGYRRVNRFLEALERLPLAAQLESITVEGAISERVRGLRGLRHLRISP